MLHKSFKAGKCKTSLKLAVARIKLLKNKREVQLRQMKRDLAKLLQTGQEKTAMIRVEHLVREEKTMGAYDLIDIYCELIVARLPIIESQKNCPIDLKEAISSLIFASPRCADIPELQEVHKLFKAKYGKEFITSSLELRPDCGVNRNMVEKLSARTPDGQTKLKILNEIAQEHNVEWDPKAFGEKELMPPEDLLNGPRVTETVGPRPVEPYVPYLPPTNRQKPESSYVENVNGSSQSSQNSHPTNIRTPDAAIDSSMEQRASGGATDGREFQRPSFQNENYLSPNRQNWNMEFKDATSAAQAAAESAERASFAARAAAELSGFGKQYSTGCHKPLMQDQHRYRNEKDDVEGFSDSMLDSHNFVRRRSNHSDSLRSSMANDDSDVQIADKYCQKCSSEVEAVNNKKPDESHIQARSGVESVNHQQHINSGGVGHSFISTDAGIMQSGTKQPSFDDYPSVVSDDSVGHSFISTDTGITQSGTKQPTFDDYPSVLSDDSVSDEESTGHKHGLYIPSADTKLPSQFSENLSTWSPGEQKEIATGHSHFVMESDHSSEFSERISKTSQSGALLPATFDDSDGLDSESEEELNNAKHSGEVESTIPLHQQNSFAISSESAQGSLSSVPEKESKGINRKPWLHSSSDDSDSDGAHPWKDNYGVGDRKKIQPSGGHKKNSNRSVGDKEMSYNPMVEEEQPAQSSSRPLNKDIRKGSDIVAPGSPDNVKDSEISFMSYESGELDFGRLRGGFRNKGYTRPPYRKGLSVDNSPLYMQQETEDNPTIEEQPIDTSVVRTSTNSESLYQETYKGKNHADVRKKTSSSSPKTIFYSDSDDAEVYPLQSAGNRGKSGGRLSRRTRESPAQSDVNSISTSKADLRRGSGSSSTIKSNVSAEQVSDPQPRSKRGDNSRLARTNISVEHQPSKSPPKTETSYRNESLDLSHSSKLEQSSISATDSGTAETSKLLSLDKGSPSRENSLKKAGHVHPKLPDYDSFAAHFESLKLKR
ncbi:hypothetical protein IFM89_014849 [Coptis chinensis]|uniref:IST1-like protein n=1 Tax=Coptis chinensis TaxID=261450 RepID=A0A835M4W9_9MAGN|nr:hypothetical protein IFM89_014849 [Coptis chinensis]